MKMLNRAGIGLLAAGLWAVILCPLLAEPVRHTAPYVPSTAIGFGAKGETWSPVTADTPLPVAVISGGGGGGGGSGTEYTEDAAAPANPIGGVIQARRRDTPTTAEVTADGDIITLNADNKGQLRVNLDAVVTQLGSPLQANGNIGNISGEISLPTGAATSAKQDSLLTALGTPFQAGGSIGNSSFGSTQSGTWNITNVSGTVSLPTGAATSAKQDTQTTSIDAISTRLGATSSPASGTVNKLLTDILAGVTSPALPTGAASAANQSTANASLGTIDTSTAAISTRIGATSSPASGTTNKLLTDLLAAAATASNQSTANSSLSTIAGSVDTIGTSAPSVANVAGGKDSAGNSQALLTSPSGGLLPGQAVPTSTRTTLTASTATQIDSSRSGRLLSHVQLETSPAANVFICFSQTTSCSATVYDIMVAADAAAGTIYTTPFGSTAAIYAYSTGTPVVNVGSWLAQ